MNLIARCLLLSMLVGLLSSCVAPKDMAPKDVSSKDSIPEEHRQLLHTAEQGDAEAQYNLGVMYREGMGVTEDDVQAIYWFTKAAEQGHDLGSKQSGTYV